MEQQEVAAFSFKKKPIDNFVTCHAHISEILPRTATFPVAAAPSVEAKSNTIDYNEQIRAPRFHFKTTPFQVQYKPFTNEQQTEAPVESKPDNGVEDKCDYHPAAFDLSNPFQKFSISSSNLNNDSSSSLLNNYTANNYIYSKNDRVSAISNLNENVTTEERRIKNHTGRTTSLNTNGLQQVYQMKKPMCVPAVLRPNDEGSGTNSASTSASGSSSMALSSMLTSNTNSTPKASASNASSTQSSNRSSISAGGIDYLDYTPNEPSHKHWKPNNSYCMLCFENFSNLQILRKRRHHCRFCGINICTSCLYVNEDVNNAGDTFNSAYLDSECRLVVPVLKNLLGAGLSFKSLANYFKLCKLCKKCGDNYVNALLDINGQSVNLPFVFIENPYLSSSKSTKDPEAEKPKERQPSLTTGAIPTDWNWSSF